MWTRAVTAYLLVGEVIRLTNGALVVADPTAHEDGVERERLEAWQCASWSADSREVERGGVFLAVGGGERFVDEAVSRGAEIAIAETALSGLPTIVVDDVPRAVALLAQYRRQHLAIPVIAIAGSSGKTSTKNLLAAALSPLGLIHSSKRSFNNEIGVPITLLECPPDAQAVVVECGERRRGDLAYLGDIVHPTGVVVTSLGLAHAEFLGGIEGVALECGDLITRSKTWVVAHDADLAEISPHMPPTRERVAVCIEPPSQYEHLVELSVASLEINENGTGHIQGTGKWGPFDATVQLLGKHQARNAAVALAAAARCGVSLADASAAIATVLPAEGRGQMRIREDGLRIIDDSYNANPDSVRAGLEMLAEIPSLRRVAILGEMRELGEGASAAHAAIGRRAGELGIDVLIPLGPYRGELQTGFEERAGAPAITVNVDTMNEIARHIASGDLVLVKASRGAQLERIVELLMESAP